MKISLSKRIVSFVLCLTVLLAGFAYKPQKTEAFAISASLVASVIMIMTACGVTFWASTQGDAESYISQKLGEYLDHLNPSPASILDWLGIDDLGQLFVVLSGGIVRFDSNVANPILSFVRWFNQNEGVESGGDSVGDFAVPDGWNVSYSGAAFNGSWTASATGLDTFTVTLDNFSKSSSISYLTLSIPFPSDRAMVECIQVTGNPRMSVILGSSTTQLTCDSVWERQYSIDASDGYLVFQFKIANVSAVGVYSASSVFSVNADFASASASVAPSAVVSVPNDLTEDDNFVVTPSVGLTQGMSVDDASSEIFDGVTSTDGLTSTGESVDSGEVVDPPSIDLSGILEALGSILNAILAIPGHIAALPSAIASAFSSLLTSIKSVLDSIADWVASIAQTVLGLPEVIGQAAQDVITGIQSLPRLISDALVNLFVPDEAYIGEFVASLHGIFDNRFSILSYPFSILGEFITRASGIDDDEPILRWPDIYEPFSGQILIRAGSYNLNRIRTGSFSEAHGLYMVVIKGLISFEFLGYLYSWFCSVFKMREEDFASPLDAYGGDDE